MTKVDKAASPVPKSAPSGAREMKRLPNQRFERIKTDSMTFQHDRLKDNSYEARVSDSPACSKMKLMILLSFSLVLR